MTLDSSFFIDFETPLFRSALFATETSTSTFCSAATATTPATCTKNPEDETSRTDLYADTSAAFSELMVGVGMKL
jgi:hypothetical protein